MCKHYNIIVTGKVQGVWFRKYTQEKAKSLNLKGTVQNLPDGNVYVEVESDDDKRLQGFIDWLHTGSPLSKVNQVIVEQGSCKNYQSFEIVR